jgi:mannose-6-phosphate isomerase-like protein (cupin superfamily)
MPTLPDGRSLDQVAASQHDVRHLEDYRLLREAGLLTVREAVRWPLVDRGERLDFSTLAPMVRSLRQLGMTAVWDLCHYGCPTGVDLFSPEFPGRFARYCAGVASYLGQELPPPRFYTPINEISYFSYAAGERGYFAPFGRGRGVEAKHQLVRAALEGIRAIQALDPAARFLHVDPLVRLVPPEEEPGLAPEVDFFNNEVVYEAWRMLAGRLAPELGGWEGALDLVGLNLYPLCQWEYQRPGRFLSRDHPRWTPVRTLLKEAWQRLRRPILIGETGTLASERAEWLRYLFAEVRAAQAEGVPILGICWYPVVSCPDWQDPTTVMRGGLWDAVPAGNRLQRVPDVAALEAVQEARREQAEAGRSRNRYALRDSSPGQAPAPSLPLRVPNAAPPVAAPAALAQLRRASVHDAAETPENFGRALLLAGEHLSTSAYTFLPGQTLGLHDYPGVEVALCAMEGEALVFDEEGEAALRQGEVMVVPAGTPFGIRNRGAVLCRVLQVATPRPWSADFQGPEPPNLEG